MNNPHPSVFIEKYLPLELLNQQVYYEHGRNPFKGLHRWYSRKPLSLSRASVLASILPSDITSEEFEILLGMDDNVRLYKTPPSNDIIERVKDYCEKTWGTRTPTILDAFGGGGSIPFEAARYKLNVLASDLNPVAVLTMKAAIEYPLKFGPELQQHIDKWVEWVGIEAEKRLSQFFPSLPGESIQNYLWAHTVKCPSCSTEVPLSPNWWLSKTSNYAGKGKARKVTSEWSAVKPVPNPENKKVDFELIKGHKGNGATIKLDNVEFDPSDYNTITNGVGRCPNCGEVFGKDFIEKQKASNKSGHQLYAVAYQNENGETDFRLPNPDDTHKFITNKDLIVDSDRDNLATIDKESIQNYLWAHTVKCPSCSTEVPLSPNWWLYKRPEKQNHHKWTAVKPVPDPKNKKVDFELIKGHKGNGTTIKLDDIEFNPSDYNTIKRGVGRCPNCGSKIKDNIIKAQAKSEGLGHQLYAVAFRKNGGSLEFRLPEKIDFEGWELSKDYLSSKLAELKEKGLVPDVKLPYMHLSHERSSTVELGLTHWHKFFNDRQLLVLSTYTEIIQEVKELLRKDYSDDEVEAIATYLTLVLDRCVDKNSRLSRFHVNNISFENASSFRALNIMWNYPETEAKNLWTNCFNTVTKDYTKLCGLLEAEIHPGDETNRLFSYNINKWTDMFNSRQLLTLITYTEIIQEVKELLRKDYSDEEVEAIATYLTLVLDRCVDGNSRLSIFHSARACTQQASTHHALNLMWNYLETEAKNLWDNCLKDVTKDYTKLCGLLEAEIHPGDETNRLFSYDINKWTDMFNSRQLLTLLTYTEIIQEVKESLRKDYSEDKVEAIATYLTLVLDRCVDKNSRLSIINVARVCIERASTQHALNLNWNYPETEAKDLWDNCLKDVTKDYTKLCELLEAEIHPGEMPNQILNYGINKWTDMFNSRQLLTLITYTEIIEEVKELLRKDYSDDKVEAIATYLSLMLDRCIDINCRLTHLNSSIPNFQLASAQHALNLTWNYVETAGNIKLWEVYASVIAKSYLELCNIVSDAQQLEKFDIIERNLIDIRSASADNLTHIPDKSVEVIVTDPPYYDTIQYAELSDFFYVWQRAVLSDIFPDLYHEDLTEKDKEVVANASRFKDKEANAKELARIDYEHKLLNVFKEHNRVLRDDGVMTIQFNHKNIDAWDCLSRSLIEAGFAVTASWEVVTENPQNLHQRNKKSISSTILLVCRKRLSTEVATWENIKPLIIESISSELVLTEKNKLNIEDFHSKLFGLALKKFSMYDKVLDDKGETVRPKAVFLEVVSAIANFNK